MKMAEYVVLGKIDKLPLLENSNPMEQLSQTPSNYLGELASSEAAAAPGGNWYFDRGERSLVYRVNNVSYFETELAGPPRARFRVRLQFQDRNGNGVFDAGEDKLEGVVLTPLEPYRWLNY
jgi:general secretion pathway protein G